ncbi:HC-toxin synthetase [Diaporthe helianthi]|uniref:HC-toxin synthetase n=1 Tax=Diaporthe helianthi TaxID=158607 RepID=A0A2P5HH36_DIAHE|nr:HC-toxin synthetase [Diaporthe helianthi]
MQQPQSAFLADTRQIWTWNAAMPEAIDGLLHGLFVEKANEAPDALAVDAWDAITREVTTTVAALITPDEVPLVNNIIFGAELLSHAACAPWDGKTRVINTYGPTECCVDCVFSDFKTSSAPGIIGTSAGSVTWVVDPNDHNRLMPISLTGELLIEGPVLARSYLNNLEKTAEALGRALNTGDLVKYTADGNIVYVGRKDTQVKTHGQRVELGEVESQVSEHLPQRTRVIDDVVSYADGTQALMVFVHFPKERTPSASYEISGAPFPLERMVESTSLQTKTLHDISLRNAREAPDAWAVVTMLAILKAGGAFVPLDPKQPKLRRETVIKEIQFPVMVASAASAGLLQADGGVVIVVGPSVVDIQRLRSGPRRDYTLPQDISPRIRCVYTIHFWKPHTRVLRFTSYKFDAMVDEIFMTPVCGGCICIPSDEDAMIGLNGSIRDFGINSLALISTILRLKDTVEVLEVDSVMS